MKDSSSRDSSTSDNAAPKVKPEPKPLPRLWPLQSLLGEVVNDATEAHNARRNNEPRGPITGLKSLDREIGGAIPKDALTMILGNTGAGKTAFAGQICAHCACPAVYLTTEMAPVELLRRHTARTTTTLLGKLKSGELMPEQVSELVGETVRQLDHLSIIDGTTAYAPIRYLLEVMETVKADAKHAVLVIDSLHTWARGSGVNLSEYEALNDHLTGLGRLAKQARCSVLIICEQSRAAMDGGGVNSGAGSRFIEYSADLVLDLKAEKGIKGSGEKSVTLTLAKNRHGAAGKPLELEFNGALQRFREAEK